MRGPLVLAAAITAMSACAPSTRPAPDIDKTSPSPEFVDAMRLVDDIVLAWSLAEYGRNAGSPVALVAAAQIFLDRAPLVLDGTSEQPREDVDIPLGLLAEAEALDRDGDNIGMIRTLRARAASRPRGARGLPRHRQDVLPPQSDVEFGITFLGDEPAIVKVTGDPAFGIDLVVYDDAGTLIGTGPAQPEAVVSWTPADTRRFRIVLRNSNSARQLYTIVTN